MPTELTLRDAVPSDARVICSIHNESIYTQTATMETVLKTPSEVVDWMAHLDEREALLVAELDGEVVGWGVVKKYSERPGYRWAGETSVYLRRELRGRGIGTRLKKALIERCSAIGYHYLLARIVAANAESIEYNLRLGYEWVGVMREAGRLAGDWCDIAVLQLVLDGPDEDDHPAW